MNDRQAPTTEPSFLDRAQSEGAHFERTWGVRLPLHREVHMLRLVLAHFAVAVIAANSAHAQLAPASDRPVSIQGGIGLTADPGGFLFGVESDYRFHRNWSVAARLKVAFDDDLTIVAPAGNLRYWFDFSRDGNQPVSPFIQSGIGFSYVDKKGRAGGDSDTGFLTNLGAGIEARISDDISLTSTASFNLLPDSVLDENVYFSWEVAALRYRF